MTRFLCVLLLVGLVATPRSEPDVQSSAGTGETRQALSGASLRSSWVHAVATSGALLDGRSSVPRPRGGGPILLAARIRGTSTWYCSATSACTRGYSPSDLVAAIDPSTGFHKGDQLRVRSGGKSVRVTIVDVCLCRGQRVIDLTSGAFRRLAPLSRGVIPVSLELVGGIDVPLTRPAPTAPPTDVE